jgi:ribosomal protein L11 methyltransferase
MLRPPHTRYRRLYVYHLSLAAMPEIDDPDYIGGWIEDGTAILFFHRDRGPEMEELCRREGCGMIYQADLDYEDWEAGLAVERFSCGGLSFAPVWEATGADIVIDPSVVFGSGFHPSTRLAIEGMCDLLARAPGVDSVLDLGCGTGILAIAAARKGVRRIAAVDNNPLACRVAERNAAANHVEITVQNADLRKQEPRADADLLVANLYHALLLDLFGKPWFWRPRFHLLAGFIPAMEEELLAALPDPPPRFLDRRRRERWCMWLLESPAG